jgi:hypothetical protein
MHFVIGSVALSRLLFHVLCLFQFFFFPFLVLRFGFLSLFKFRRFVFLDASCIALLVRSPSAVCFSMFYVSVSFFFPFLVLRFGFLSFFRFRRFVFLDASCISLLVRSPSAVWFSMFYVSVSFVLPFFGSSFWLPVFVYVSSVPFFGRFLHFFIGSPSAVCITMLYVSSAFFSFFWFFVLGAYLRFRFVA